MARSHKDLEYAGRCLSSFIHQPIDDDDPADESRIGSLLVGEFLLGFRALLKGLSKK